MTATTRRSAAATTPRDDLATAGLATWLVFGLFLDGYAHSNILDGTESFFTPWHAVFYSGFLATAGWVVYLVIQRMMPGEPWYRAIPRGYHSAVAGSALFAVGGVGDGTWHTLFGVETSLDALLSPTHLLLFSGLMLILVSPFLAAQARRDDGAPSLREFLPPLLSLLLATSLVAFFFSYLWAPARPYWYLFPYNPLTDDGEVFVGAGVASALVASVVLTAPLVLALRRWRPPLGSFTLLWGTVNALVAIAFDLDLMAITAGLAGGAAADALTRQLGAGPDRPWAAHAVALAAPAVLMSAVLFVLNGQSPIEWQVELWTGTIFFAGLAGLGLSLMARPGTAA